MTRLRVAAAVAAALLLGACSSKPEAPQPSTTQPTPSATQTSTAQTSTTEPSAPGAHGNLADCLHAHGVPESAGPAVVLGPPEGVDPATWDQAMKACSTFAPGPAGS
ncbi:hypothetical protein [Mycolicibacterium sp.]|uniref:hypothetical protein n=1 Tax=Mycolicibacterium sp. TaxID=2320850 RepID=UPI0025FF4E3D|nr:hypothetical protein [Mycolicibacterium sp.]